MILVYADNLSSGKRGDRLKVMILAIQHNIGWARPIRFPLSDLEFRFAGGSDECRRAGQFTGRALSGKEPPSDLQAGRGYARVLSLDMSVEKHIVPREHQGIARCFFIRAGVPAAPALHAIHCIFF